MRMSKFGVFTALTFRLVFLFNVNVCSSNVNCVPSFVRNACYEHGSDVRFMKMTYDVCVENCVRRASCVSVNFHAQMGYCVLHTVEAITKVPCALDGMVFSMKADWTEETKQLPPECSSCSLGQTCVKDTYTDSNSCQVTECGNPRILHGSVTGNMVLVGSRVKVKCDHLYSSQLGTVFTMMCLSTGQWEHPETICKSACPDDAVVFQDSCYFMGIQEVDFDTAAAYCSSAAIFDEYTPYVITPTTQEEYDHIVWVLESQALGNLYWVGIKRNRQYPETWYYVHTGQNTTWIPWAPPEPNDSSEKNDDCVAFSAGLAGFNDLKCSATYKPFCEIG